MARGVNPDSPFFSRRRVIGGQDPPPLFWGRGTRLKHFLASPGHPGGGAPKKKSPKNDTFSRKYARFFRGPLILVLDDG